MRGSATSGSWVDHRRGRGAGLTERAVDVGDRVGVAAFVRLLRGPAGELRLGAERLRRGVGEELPVGGQVAVRIGAFDQEAAAAGLQADEGAVAVESLAPAGEVGQRVEEL